MAIWAIVGRSAGSCLSLYPSSALLFGGLAIVYVCFGIAIRHDDVRQNSENQEDLTSLKKNFNSMFPLVTSLSLDMADMKRSGMGNLAPQVVEDFEKKSKAIGGLLARPEFAQTLQLAKDNYCETKTRECVLTVAPGVVSEIVFEARKWSDEDNGLQSVRDRLPYDQARHDAYENTKRAMAESNSKRLLPLLRGANYIRQDLLKSGPVSPDDKRADAIFAQALAGTPINWSDMVHIADYMQDLLKEHVPPPAN
jgi:hypothetical protein